MEVFTDSQITESLENPETTYANILSKMSNTFYWRKDQLANGKIELRNKQNSKLLDENYGSILLNFLELKKEDSKFDDFKTLVNLPS